MYTGDVLVDMCTNPHTYIHTEKVCGFFCAFCSKSQFNKQEKPQIHATYGLNLANVNKLKIVWVCVFLIKFCGFSCLLIEICCQMQIKAANFHCVYHVRWFLACLAEKGGWMAHSFAQTHARALRPLNILTILFYSVGLPINNGFIEEEDEWRKKQTLNERYMELIALRPKHLIAENTIAFMIIVIIFFVILAATVDFIYIGCSVVACARVNVCVGAFRSSVRHLWYLAFIFIYFKRLSHIE